VDTRGPGYYCKWLVAVVAGIMLSLCLPLYALAIDDPDDVEILSVKVFQNLWETGDQLYFVEYNVEYGTEPDEDSEDTYVFQIYDGATMMAQTPLPYYQVHIVSIYFEPSDALIWGSSYVIRIGGNYSVPFPSGVPEERRSLSSTDWLEGDEDASRTLLGEYVIQIAEDLEDRWGGSITLLTTTNKLNSTGALTFGECIPGLADICPDYFETSVEYPEFDRETEATALQASATAQMSARLQTALDGIGTFVGMPGAFVGGVGLAIIFFILAGRIFTATQSVPIAIVASIPLIFLANLIGLISVAITWAAVIVVCLVFAVVFILGRFA